MNVNKAFVVGRVTADPELRKTASGQSVTSFGVATNRVWNDKSGTRQEETEFHNVVAWGRTAEIASQFLTKGSLVFVEGRLQTRTWEDKQGVSRKSTEIVCERLQLGPRPAGQRGGGGSSRSQSQNAAQAEPKENIPVIDMDGGGNDEDNEIPF